MQINNDLIEYLEGLSKLRLTDAERQSVTEQLQEFIEYTQMLSTAELPAVDLTQTASLNLRADEAKPSMPVDDVLANAPERQGDFFVVPRSIE